MKRKLSDSFKAQAWLTTLALSGSLVSLASAAERDDSVTLDEIVVTGKMLDYNMVESANKMPMSVKDTPQSVKVITEDMLDFGGVNNFNDLFKLDAGGHAANSGYRQTYHYSRGFSTSPSGGSSGIKVDGFRTATQFLLDMAAFERIELVKGSTSTLYGQASLAGTMNAITKKPKSERGGEMKLEVGSYDWYRGEADFYGAITDDEKLSYRFVGTYTDAESYIRGGYEESYLLAPSIQYEFTENTVARLLVGYERSKTPGNAGIGLLYTGVGEDAEGNEIDLFAAPDVDHRRQIYPSWASQTRHAVLALGTLEHEFENQWQLRAAATHYRTASEMHSGYILNTVRDGSELEGTAPFSAEASTTTYLSQGAEVNFNGPFELFGQKHHAFVGVDLTRFGSQPSKYASASIDTPFSIYGTDFSTLPQANLSDYLPGGRFAETEDRYIENSANRNKQWGVTAQLLVRPTDRWSVLLGARRSDVSSESAYYGCYGPESESPCGPNTFERESRPAYQDYKEMSAEKTTYQAGTVFEITEHVNIYASYGEVFEPRDERAFDPGNAEGRPLGPEEGEAYELGLKGDLFDRQLSWSLGVFDIARTNVVTEDPDNLNFVLPAGEQRAKGVEIDVQGNVLPGLGIYVSLAQLKNEFTKGDFKGFRSNLGPKFGASVFANYELQDGALQGLGFGAGVVYKDRVTAYDMYNRGAPIAGLSEDILLVDAHAYYNHESWTYQLSATNIFDEDYWALTRDSGSCCTFGSTGPEVRLSLSRRFGAADRR